MKEREGEIKGEIEVLGEWGHFQGKLMLHIDNTVFSSKCTFCRISTPPPLSYPSLFSCTVNEKFRIHFSSVFNSIKNVLKSGYTSLFIAISNVIFLFLKKHDFKKLKNSKRLISIIKKLKKAC